MQQIRRWGRQATRSGAIPKTFPPFSHHKSLISPHLPPFHRAYYLRLLSYSLKNYDFEEVMGRG